MKILAVDYGDARTGLAVCDRQELLASPLEVIHDKRPEKVVERPPPPPGGRARRRLWWATP